MRLACEESGELQGAELAVAGHQLQGLDAAHVDLCCHPSSRMAEEDQ